MKLQFLLAIWIVINISILLFIITYKYLASDKIRKTTKFIPIAIPLFSMFIFISCNRDNIPLTGDEKIPNIENLSSKQKLGLLAEDKDFTKVAEFQIKFLNKVIKSGIEITPQTLASDDLLKRISYDSVQFSKDQKEASNAAKRLLKKFEMKVEGCSTCSLSKNSPDGKFAVAAKLMNRFKSNNSELRRFKLSLSADKLRALSNYENIKLSSVSDSETGSTECSYAYYACILGCAGATGGVLGAACVYVCYCGFCHGPTVDTLCGN